MVLGLNSVVRGMQIFSSEIGKSKESSPLRGPQGWKKRQKESVAQPPRQKVKTRILENRKGAALKFVLGR